jgi:glycosyltransferase involved in cell wall biosynthesis
MTEEVLLSLVIPVRDRWECLRRCLEALTASCHPPSFEVIVIDDGSKVPAPRVVSEGATPYPLRFLAQPPTGISAARNRGVAHARGAVILFIDSDCRVHPDCLHHLAGYVRDHPSDLAFQLRITGDNTLVGHMERLRNEATLQTLATEDQHVAYANTSGFAVRRACLEGPGLFDPHVTRGEDSLVLQRILARGHLPRYACESIVFHAPPYSPLRHTLRHFRIGYHTGKARRLIAEGGPLLMRARSKCEVLRRMWRATSVQPRQVGALGLCLVAYSLEVLGRKVYTLRGPEP